MNTFSNIDIKLTRDGENSTVSIRITLKHPSVILKANKKSEVEKKLYGEF